MKKLIIVVIILVIAVFGLCRANLIHIGSAGPGKTPEQTVKSAVLALAKLEPEKVTLFFTPRPGAAMATHLTALYANMESLDIEDLHVTLILDEGIAARVQATYNMTFTAQGFTNTEHCSKIIKLVKIDGKWWINDVF